VAATSGASHTPTASYLGNSFAWTGQRYDAAVGLYGFHFRTYSPDLGRWLQRDPVGYVDGVDLYEYVLGNPLCWLDPFGLAPCDDEAMTRDEFIRLLRRFRKTYSRMTTEELIRMLESWMKNHGYALYGGRYIYVEGHGWIDMLHFFAAARYASYAGDKIAQTLGWALEILQAVKGDPSMTAL
jgi:RHS repeat-associated protein